MPLKRHPALVPLSRDHHRALQLAVALRSDGSRHLREHLPASPRALATYVCRYFDDELAPHFATEELELMVAVDGLDREVDTICADLRRDHDKLRAIIAQLRRTSEGAILVALLDRFGRLLEDHVRAEEQTLFARVPDLLDEKVLAEIAPRLDNGDPATRTQTPPHSEPRRRAAKRAF